MRAPARSPRAIPSRLPHVLYKEVRFQDEYGTFTNRVLATVENAQVVSSELRDVENGHAPVLDIDVPARLVPSSTPGHSHLYIDVRMPWRRYRRLLKALGRAGILEPGYVKASVRRRHSAVRVPWVKKEKP